MGGSKRGGTPQGARINYVNPRTGRSIGTFNVGGTLPRSYFVSGNIAAPLPQRQAALRQARRNAR